ncbi:Thiol-disulfide isomerase-like thioredoxin [Frankia canadensis]|uniref:Thiol-disulfide isomerase-like thioredoxin n=1 Tax=Frankia canadensis TaxID=1836972 RepID=A0A2I2KWG5_9ACTN|nr:thioredoxin family protein [Frankia canadensis]SNQ50023.1 Thiol-disulfide isomerase-like thioredoxin [Frankia canadensis]SOU57313.1 Thiol-disulfide isomerase-like thioredoxin [Frankia canadensis]
MTGVWVLLAAVVVALVIGVASRRRDGRLRPRRSRVSPPVVSGARLPRAVGLEGGLEGSVGSGVGPAPGEVAADGLGGELAALGAELGERATLLQFSTAFCAPCRTTRRVLAGVAETVPGVRHVEVDAEAHLGLVRRLGVRRTPTVLVLDGHGLEVRRASGAPPSRDAVFATLAEIVPPGGDQSGRQ